MATEHLTDAEVFHQFLAIEVKSAGRSKSPEDLLRIWRERQREQAETLEAIQEGLADIEAGRVHSFDEVNEQIRRKHGWSTPDEL